MIIRVKFIKSGQAQGREYSYFANEPVSIGDIVLVGTGQKAMVTALDVPESEIEQFKDRVKSIIGKEEQK